MEHRVALGSRLTTAPADSKLSSVLLSLEKKDAEDPKNQDSGDYLDNPHSAFNIMLALARYGTNFILEVRNDTKSFDNFNEHLVENFNS